MISTVPRMQFSLRTEDETLAFGKRLFEVLESGAIVFLHGELGAGKTTLVRGYLRAAGYRGAVKSPTYTLVEEYFIGGRRIYHFDLYRLADPEELEWIGIRDYLGGGATCFVEWPERGAAVLPRPDLSIRLAAAESGRKIELEFFGDAGLALADRLG